MTIYYTKLILSRLKYNYPINLQLARENYNEKILNILHRLDFNGFYSKALDTFRGHPSKEVPPAVSTKSTTISYPN